MAVEVIQKFTPQLVTAVSSCIQAVSDQCLAKGLITDGVYRTVLESRSTNEDKARNLLRATKDSIQTESQCFEIFLSILESELPYTSRETLISAIREEFADKDNTCRAVVLVTQDIQLLQSEKLSQQCILQQHSLISRLEDSVRKHESACTEKSLLEERLKTRTEENERLRAQLEVMTSQGGQDDSSSDSGSDKANLEARMQSCESEIAELRERIDSLKHVIEQQRMRVKQGKTIGSIEMKKLTTQMALISQQEITRVREESRRKEETHMAELKEKENTLIVALREKDEEYTMALRAKSTEIEQRMREEIRVRELEHRLALQERDNNTRSSTTAIVSVVAIVAIAAIAIAVYSITLRNELFVTQDKLTMSHAKLQEVEMNKTRLEEKVKEGDETKEELFVTREKLAMSQAKLHEEGMDKARLEEKVKEGDKAKEELSAAQAALTDLKLTLDWTKLELMKTNTTLHNRLNPVNKSN